MLALALFAVPILVSDWRYRRIPNIYILIILYWVLMMRVVFGTRSITTIILALSVALAAVVIMRMGMGDAKLFSIIALALNLPSTWSLSLLILCISLCAIAQIIITCACTRRVPSSIPLAFAIIFGTALYLAAGRRLSLQQYAYALVNSW